MPSPWSFIQAYIIPASLPVGLWLGGGWTWLTIVVTFGLIPILDILIGADRRNVPEGEARAFAADKRFRWVTWPVAPVQLAVVIWGAWVVTNVPLTPIELTGFVLGVGLCGGGIGINTAHELVHQPKGVEALLGHIALVTVGYQHWAIEHVFGHHRWVATPNDPATARFGESLYAFFPRTIIGTFRSAWHIEAGRLARRNLPVWSIHNGVLRGLAAEIALAAGLTAAFGPWALVFFAVQALIAILLLEAVNYIEHYGLERLETAPGKYENVLPLHSWNASEYVTNHFLWNLQRHSDHHAHAARRYQILRHFDEAPQLPTGYAGMIVLAAVPPLWFRIMDPLVQQNRDQQAAWRAAGKPSKPADDGDGMTAPAPA